MRILAFIITLLITTNCYALRLETPPLITDLTNTNELTTLNNYLEKLQSIVNGKYNLDVETSAPTWTGEEGDMVVYSSGGVYRIYIYLEDAWRVWTSD